MQDMIVEKKKEELKDNVELFDLLVKEIQELINEIDELETGENPLHLENNITSH